MSKHEQMPGDETSWLLTLNGATLWFAAQGQGLPVVLISGGPGTILG
ncbi:MAG: hypothetical protein IGS38_23470 [Synechococcales cyanobacterium M58_A2018_015]|nr:hypothetical protein [Synechococcales cyanobacterium M58_A2018_015]